ncbi:bromo adjacent homology domain, zinc finger, RING/FYVE/PHD-type containing protein [Tanacetum coccineum]
MNVNEVERIDEDTTGNVMVRVKLCYHPEDTIGDRRPFHGKNELFLTNHTHTQSAHKILRKCVLRSFLSYARLKDPGEHDYFIRFHYDHETGWFSPDAIEVSSSPYNGIIGRPGVRKLQAVPSTTHGMLKILVEGGVITLKSSKLVPWNVRWSPDLKEPNYQANNRRKNQSSSKSSISGTNSNDWFYSHRGRPQQVVWTTLA